MGRLTWEWAIDSVGREEMRGKDSELDLSKDGGCKGEGIKVLLRKRSEVGIGELAEVRNRGLKGKRSGF